MREIIENGACIHLFDSAEEVLKSAENPRGYSRMDYAFQNSKWTGAYLPDWDSVRTKVRGSWEEGRKRVEAIKNKVGSGNLPKPESRTRKHRWSEDDGEVNSDRLLRGESDFYRETYRTHKTGAQNITILTHLGGSCNRSSENLFLSAAATIAVLDLLEEAGFSCDIWGYSVVAKAWARNDDTYMMGVKLKDSGSPLDVDSLVSICSGWFFRTAGIGSVDDREGAHAADGYGRPLNSIGRFVSYLDLENTIVVEMPDVYSEDQAIEAARDMINSIIEQGN
jgi:hypothetical protein